MASLVPGMEYDLAKNWTIRLKMKRKREARRPDALRGRSGQPEGFQGHHGRHADKNGARGAEDRVQVQGNGQGQGARAEQVGVRPGAAHRRQGRDLFPGREDRSERHPDRGRTRWISRPGLWTRRSTRMPKARPASTTRSSSRKNSRHRPALRPRGIEGLKDLMDEVRPSSVSSWRPGRQAVLCSALGTETQGGEGDHVLLMDPA